MRGVTGASARRERQNRKYYGSCGYIKSGDDAHLLGCVKVGMRLKIKNVAYLAHPDTLINCSDLGIPCLRMALNTR